MIRRCKHRKAILSQPVLFFSCLLLWCTPFLKLNNCRFPNSTLLKGPLPQNDKVTWVTTWMIGTYKHGDNNSRLYHPRTCSALFYKKKALSTSAWARSVYLIFISVWRCIDRTARAPKIRQYSNVNRKKHKIKFITKETLCKRNSVVTVTVMIR